MTSTSQTDQPAVFIPLFYKRAWNNALAGLGKATSMKPGDLAHRAGAAGAAAAIKPPETPAVAPATPPTPAAPVTGGANTAPQAPPNPARPSVPTVTSTGGFGGMGVTGTPGTGMWHTAQIDPTVGTMGTKARQGTLDALAGRNYTDWNNSGTSGTMMSKQPDGSYQATAGITRQVDANGKQTGAQINSRYGTGSSTTIPTVGTDAYKQWANNRSFTNDKGETFKGPDAMQKGVQQITDSNVQKAQEAAGAQARQANPQGYANTQKSQVDAMDPNSAGKSQYEIARDGGLITPQGQAGIAEAGNSHMPAAPNPNAPNMEDPFKTAPAVPAANIASATPPATTPATGQTPPTAPPAAPAAQDITNVAPPPAATPSPPAATPSPPAATPSPAAIAGANQMAAANPEAFHGGAPPVAAPAGAPQADSATHNYNPSGTGTGWGGQWRDQT